MIKFVIIAAATMLGTSVMAQDTYHQDQQMHLPLSNPHPAMNVAPPTTHFVRPPHVYTGKRVYHPKHVKPMADPVTPHMMDE